MRLQVAVDKSPVSPGTWFRGLVSLGKGTNKIKLYIAVKSDANSCMISREWIVDLIHFSANAFNSGMSYWERVFNRGSRRGGIRGPYPQLGIQILLRLGTLSHWQICMCP